MDTNARTYDEHSLSFRPEVSASLMQLGAALQSLVSAPSKLSISQTDLRTMLGLDAKLAWNVHALMRESGSLAAGLQVPGPGGFRTLLQAAKTRGLSEESIQAVADAAAEFEAVVRRHAGDRATYEIMVSDMVSAAQRESFLLAQTRSAFRANRYIRGVEAATQLKCVVLQPSFTSESIDIVAIQGYLDLRRLRPGTPIVLSRVRLSNDDRSVRRTEWQPLSGDTSSGRFALDSFCSHPVPETRSICGVDGFAREELVESSIGNRSLLTYLDGLIGREAIPRYQDTQNHAAEILTWVPIPCESLILDVVIGGELLGNTIPTVAACCAPIGLEASTADLLGHDRFLLPSPVVPLGSGLAALQCADHPGHVDMYREVFGLLGWDPASFQAHRCRIPYPVMLSSILIQLQLAKR